MQNKKSEIRKMASVKDKIKDFFTKKPVPHSAFQISSLYLTGGHFSPSDGKIKNHFVFPLEREIVQPSFNKKNIKKPELLERKIKEGIERLRISDHRVGFILPELCQKAFVFSFDSLPPSQKEREQIIRFRVKKQIPLLARDARVTFDLIKSNDQVKILASIIRAAVVEEYENFFSQLKLKVKTIGAPIICLSNLLDWEKEKNFLLVNIEEDSYSLLAVLNSGIVLCRQKSSTHEYQNQESLGQKNATIVQEIENTANFIEDREKKKIDSLWLRIGLLDSEEETFSYLKGELTFPVKRIESLLKFNLTAQEKKMLSPLIGQIL
ncbi:MAG: hypothetical protein KAU91_06280 [Candidatus Aminicenantes bacterium]|nr:hypothetical protein [Candidatus Aminicenantes bacterium]